MPDKKTSAKRKAAPRTHKVVALTSFSANVDGVDKSFSPDQGVVEVDHDTYTRLKHLFGAEGKD